MRERGIDVDRRRGNHAAGTASGDDPDDGAGDEGPVMPGRGSGGITVPLH